MSIGKRYASNEHVDGFLDELMVFNRTLSPEEINASYNNYLYPLDANITNLTDGQYNYTTGPTSNDQVMCLTCHRAHATPFKDATRWDMAADFLVDSHPAIAGTDSLGNPIFDGGATQDDIDNMYYGYSFTNDQRSLCNKCHVKDFGDEGNHG